MELKLGAHAGTGPKFSILCINVLLINLVTDSKSGVDKISKSDFNLTICFNPDFKFDVSMTLLIKNEEINSKFELVDNSLIFRW